ncbi:hypothetical protein IIA28_15260 [candidate division KSB1 bacterium]|nr:hypothetical protein [candidate division KSB1 bacterium]
MFFESIASSARLICDVGRAVKLRGAGRAKEQRHVVWFQSWCGRVSSGVSLFKICGFLIDELSTADKSQFQENHLKVVNNEIRE